MAEKKYTWHKIADSVSEIEFSGNGMVQLNAGSKQICLIKANNHLYACTHKCPHAGGIMAEGYTDALGNIVCPLHRYKFSLQNGRNTSGEGYYLKTFPVQIQEDGVYVGFTETGFFDWLK